MSASPGDLLRKRFDQLLRVELLPQGYSEAIGFPDACQL